MNSILFDFGFFKLRWYSVMILCAVLFAFYFINKEAKKKKINEENLSNILFYGIIIGILGARVHYVLFNLSYYLTNPVEIFMIWNGGLAIHGGIIAALIFIILYCKNKKINIFLILDIIVVGVIIAQAIGRWGNFFNQEAYGRIIEIKTLQNMHLPNFIINGMYIDGKYREPTFLYESLLSLTGFISLLIIRIKAKIKTGQLTGIYFLWYGVERFIIEALRSDSLMLFNIKVAQLISILFVIAGTIIIYINRNNKLYKNNTF